MSIWTVIGLVAAAVLVTLAIVVWFINRLASDIAAGRVAGRDVDTARHRADEAVKAQETRDAVARSDFDRAVDDL